MLSQVKLLVILFVIKCCAQSGLFSKRTLSQKNYFKAMTSSRMYRIFVILAILMTSSSDDVIKFSNFEFCNSFTFIVWSYCEKIKCLSLTTLKLLLFTFWIFFRFEPILRIWCQLSFSLRNFLDIWKSSFGGVKMPPPSFGIGLNG